MSDVKASKLISLALRHRPEVLGLTLDAQGFAEVDALLAGMARAGVPLTREALVRIVAQSDKQRFFLTGDGRRIRANQGHSVEVDLGLPPRPPPPTLFHGTATRFLESIRREGLRAGARQHVHLSPDRETAIKVGARHGKPVVLEVDAGAMACAGHVFHFSVNGVWLTESVPPRFLRIPAESA